MRSFFTPFLVILILSALLSMPFRSPARRVDHGGAHGLKAVVAAAKRAATAADNPVLMSKCLEQFRESARILAGLKPVISKSDPVSPYPSPNLAFLLPDLIDMAPAADGSIVEIRETGRASGAHFRLIRPPLA